ncbi:MAG: DUF1566 domain-containing protein [Betaproteobacteria bacterium]|nr:DUF1566 domain-containing protein [Betaproteobacteria bacterium]
MHAVETTPAESGADTTPTPSTNPSTTPSITRDTPVPAIGQPWPEQGGIRVGRMAGPNGTEVELIIPLYLKDLPIDKAWGRYGQSIPDTSDKLDGAANTRGLLLSGEDCPAAQAAAEFTVENGHGRFDDWFLPAQRQLALVQANVQPIIPDGWYWSSTQYSPDGAWGSLFPDGSQGVNLKDYKGRVLPVRTVLVI